MTKSGWRTIVINNGEKIGCSYDQLVIKSDVEHIVPIEQIKIIMIDTAQTQISTKLIAELLRNNVKVIFCDEKHNPVGEITPYNSNIYALGRLYEQILWTQSDKDVMWQKIIKAKIAMQQKLLKSLKKSGGELLQQYLEEVETGDMSNREGQAARVYFNSLFGMNFRRRTENNINAALNYGYTVLLSNINRVVTRHGYHLGLGIKHCDKMNPFNLSCDIIEPFRPFVDMVVHKNGDRELDWSYKKELINISYKTVVYKGQKTELQTALDSFAFDLLENVSNINYCLKEVEMVE